MIVVVVVVKMIISVAYWTKSNQNQKLELCMKITTTTAATMITTLLRVCDSQRLVYFDKKD